MRARTHMHTRTHTHACTHKHMHTRTHTHAHTHTHTHTHAHRGILTSWTKATLRNQVSALFKHYINYIIVLSCARTCDDTVNVTLLKNCIIQQVIISNMCTVVQTNTLHLPANTLSIRGVCTYHL